MSAAAAAAAAVSAAMVDDLFSFDDEPTPAATAAVPVVATPKKKKKKKKKTTTTAAAASQKKKKKKDAATSSGKKKKGAGKKKKKEKTGESAPAKTKTKTKKQQDAAPSAGKKKKKTKKKKTSAKTGKKKKTSAKKGKSRFVDDEAAVDGTAGDDEDDDEEGGSSMDAFIDDDDAVSDGGGPAPYLGDEESVAVTAARATATMRPAQRAAAPANARPKKATAKLRRQQTMEAVTLTPAEQAARSDITEWAMFPAIMDALATKKQQNPDVSFTDAAAYGMIQKMMDVAGYVLTKKFANATPEEGVGLLSIPTQSIQMATADAFQTIQESIRTMFPDEFTLDHHFFPVASSMLATLFIFKSVTIDEIPDGAAPICQWTGKALSVGQSVYLCAYYRKTTTGSTVSGFYISHHTKFAPLYLLFIQAPRGMHRWVWSFALTLLEWQRTMSVPKEATDEVRIKRFIADDKNVPFAVAKAVMSYFEAKHIFSEVSLNP